MVVVMNRQVGGGDFLTGRATLISQAGVSVS